MPSEQLALEIGVHLGQRFTQAELESLCDVLRSAGEACSYAADDYSERAEFERKNRGAGPYDINEEDDYNRTADDFTATGAKLDELVSAIEAGERLGREDHAL